MQNNTKKKKICMVGEFAVGKTSITQKFVNNVFSEKYLTTVGVKIDTTTIDDVKLVIWDIAGRDSLSPINLNYLVGASGVIIVADGTRVETLESVPDLQKTVEERLGGVPCVIALNKKDSAAWDVEDKQREQLKQCNLPLIETSAKEGESIEKLFKTLSDLL